MAAEAGRANQRSRTRRDLLEAALRASSGGRSATLEEIAAEARVSRATAYRYFPNVEDLLAEAWLHVAFPSDDILEGASGDPVERMLLVDEAVDRMIAEHEGPLRMMIASASRRSADAADVPARQNRRLPLIEAALAPARARIAPAEFRRLARALCLVVGTEAMLVVKDVLHLTPDESRDMRRWTIRSLVEAALGR